VDVTKSTAGIWNYLLFALSNYILKNYQCNVSPLQQKKNAKLTSQENATNIISWPVDKNYQTKHFLREQVSAN